MSTRQRIAYLKDPDAKLLYGLDWATEYLESGDSINTSTWAEETSTLILIDNGIDSNITSVWISGGVVGQVYTVTNHITTANGIIDDRSIALIIEER